MKLLLAALTLSLSTAALADDTADLYKAKCGGCHGEDGRAHTKVGQKEKVPDFTSEAFQKHASDADLREVITNGSKDNPKMKAYKERLSAQEIDALAHYVRGFGGAKK